MFLRLHFACRMRTSLATLQREENRLSCFPVTWVLGSGLPPHLHSSFVQAVLAAQTPQNDDVRSGG